MTFDADRLNTRLAMLAQDTPASRYVIAFSGGLDSTALLHALSQTLAESGARLLAVHVNHRLNPQADNWAAQCRAVAESFGVDIRVEKVTVDADSDGGPEAAARRARYAVFRDIVERGDWLVTAHHEMDQAETLLLNLLRGSGPSGLAGIVDKQPFGAGLLVGFL